MIDKQIRAFVNFLLYGGVFIGIGASCITALTFEIAGHAENHINYILLIGFATSALYCGHRVIGIRQLDHIETSARFNVIRQYATHIWFWFIIWSLLAAWLLFFRNEPDVLVWMFPGGLIGLLYVLPMLPGRRRMRDFGWWKIVLIGISWGWLTAVVPYGYLMDTGPLLAIVHGIERALFIILIAIHFDVRDQAVDTSVGLKNLAEKLGRKKTIGLSFTLVPVISLLAFISTFHYINPSYVVAIMLTCILAVAMLFHAYRTKDDFFFSGLVDGLLIVTLMMYYVVNLYL